VGCYAWSADKVGRDVDALLALKPDCVVYNPMWIDMDELVRILSAGVNVVSTAAFITGHNQGPGRDRIAEACQRGGSTIFGSGISPGYIDLLAILAASICDRVDKVTVNEAADTTFYDSPATEKPVGFGEPIDHPDLAAMTAHGTGVFAEAVRMIGDALGVEFDDVRCDAEHAQTTADLDLGSWWRCPSSTRSQPSSPQPPASRPTPTCRSPCPVGWCRGASRRVTRPCRPCRPRHPRHPRRAR
jgi:hypothetical protein